MTDTVKNCEFCGKEFKAQRSTAKFCSAACKLNYNRKKGIDDLLAEKGLPPTIQASKIPIPPKKVDPPLEEQPPEAKPTGRPEPGSPEWYRHGTVDDPTMTWERVCVLCGEKYTTSLEYMRFCSEDHKSEIMTVIAFGPHKNYTKWSEEK